MGLDNGFVVKGIHYGEHGYINEIPDFIKLAFAPMEEDDGIHLCYWRKCWGIRNAINNVIHLASDKYEANIDREDIPAILRVIKHFMHPAYWEEHADSIWEYDEMIDKLIQQYMNLSWLYTYWEKHPNITVEWYDSY